MRDVESSQQISFRMWTLAVLAAVAIHVAGFGVAREYLQADDPDPELGAPALAIGVELASPRVEPSDLPPGPDLDQSAAAVAAVEQTKVLEEVLPKERPIESENPDLLVAPIEAKEVKEDQPVTPPVPAVPAETSVAVEATAIPSHDLASESARSITPEQGTGETLKRVRATWQKELIAHLDRHKRYPATSSTRSVEVLVNFVIDDSGHLLSSGIVRGSGEAEFDQAALGMLERSDPVPKPPALVVQQGLSFTLPVIFRIKHVN
jgi:periplasmic protein TonB